MTASPTTAAPAVRRGADPLLHRLLDRGLLPDWLLRVGIRRQLRARLRHSVPGDVEERAQRVAAWAEELRRSPIAVATAAANDQHYAVPPEFFRLWLGPHMKYSCALWRDGTADLGSAEEAMLDLTLQRAEIEDGMAVLDLGCGWGSLSLWLARRHPRCRVLAVSNSAPQRRYLEQRARELGLDNVRAVTCDVNDFTPDRRFDRVVSVEMMEHARNYELLLSRVASWLQPGGKMFVHVFTHAHVPYPFAVDGADDWMARHFFTGGQMPSDHLLLHFQRDLALEHHWRVRGTHYRRTAEAWLANLDRRRLEALHVLERACGGDAEARLQRWRVFLMACSELWGFRGGDEWFVSHYRMARR